MVVPCFLNIGYYKPFGPFGLLLMTSVLRSCIYTLCSNEMKIRASQSSLGNDMMALDIFSMKILMFYLLIFCCCDAVTTKKKDDASMKERNSRNAYEPVTYVKQMLLKRPTVATDTINIISNSTKFRFSCITYIFWVTNLYFITFHVRNYNISVHQNTFT